MSTQIPLTSSLSFQSIRLHSPLTHRCPAIAVKSYIFSSDLLVFDKGLKFKTATIMSSRDLIISAVIDLSIHVVDSGRNCIRGKVFFVFTLYVASKYNAHMKVEGM
uniref:Uncharacterized protein n=1 Tax=Lactuca sativa TaxID=4236 RepID=A0A9R1WJJ5_LACSA|nr:hypothetical protein LSAT_V11C200057830 [Lactuca sativa]